MAAKTTPIGIAVVTALGIAGISTAIIITTASVAIYDYRQDASLAVEETNALKQNENVPGTFKTNAYGGNTNWSFTGK